ncbi:MAG TPA: DUF1501 domain-containing protein, partial [Pirellulales bacterium]|nr:DUF1501 domain-containing protein [Pirellulales bacterium]
MHVRPVPTRREFIEQAFCGFGSLALASLVHENAARAANPLSAKRPHFEPQAKAVIFLFMAGGPSHIETFDPKPLLNRLDGQPRPAQFGEAKYQFIAKDAKLLGSKRRFARHGESGAEVSDLFPNLARHVDELAIIRSCHGDMVVHSAAQYQLFSGRTVPGFPSMGSWFVYGLGSESESLPAYVVMPDSHGALEAGQPMYANGFLPAVYQPTMLRSGERPLRNLDLPAGVSRDERRRTIELVRDLNQAALEAAHAGANDELNARISAYDLA